MIAITRVTDLQNTLADSEVLSVETLETEAYYKLKAAEREAELTDKRYSSEEALNAMKKVWSPQDKCVQS